MVSAPHGRLLEAVDLCKRYNPGKPDEVLAVRSVSLAVDEGEVLALTGPSGSGKTTLLSLIGCMSRPSSGRVVVAGRDAAKLAEEALAALRRQHFGFIFQQNHLIPDLSVVDNVLLPLVPLRMGLGTMRERTEGVLERLALSDKKRRKIRQLSGGEQQRVAIARALVNDPQVIVADEPTAHLDRELVEELMAFLEELNADGKTVVIATHDPLVFEHPLIQRRVEMRDGRIVAGEA